MVKLGYKAGPEQYPPVELLKHVIAAEEAGFETLDVSDHFHPWSEEGQASFTWTWLGAVAVKTKKMVIGPGVTCPIIRYHPSVIAQASATLDSFAPGRTYLAVGTGEALNEYSSTGFWPEYGIRQEMMGEAIELIRKLWSGKEVTHDGIYYSTRKAKLYTPPKSDIPLYVSTLDPGSAEFAGRHGDGLITVGGNPPDQYKHIFKNFKSGAKDAGKDASKMPRLIELFVAYDDDAEAAIKEMKKYWAGAFIPAMFTEKLYSPRMSQENGALVGSDTLMEKACISGDPEDHIKFIKKYVDLGFTHIFVNSAGPDQMGFIKGYGKDVLPAIRSLKK
mgnify:CR=1 FL=1